MKMKTVVREIIGILILLIGLLIVGFSVYAIIQGYSRWWDWLAAAFFGLYLMASGSSLAMKSFKSFRQTLKNTYPPF